MLSSGKRHAVGVDLGASRIRAGLLAPGGRFHGTLQVPTEAAQGPEGVLATLTELIRRVMAKAEGAPISGIGVATAGQIHPESQAVVYAPNLNWTDVPLKARLERSFGLPIWVENDVRGAAWGEFRYGAGRGSTSMMAVFVGTGVGSGAVLGGRLWRGASNAAGEIGHTQVVPDGLSCRCGNRGCLEAYASGSGFIRRLEGALAAGTRTLLAEWTKGEPTRLTATQVVRASSEGDDFATLLWSDAVRFLGLALVNAVTLLNPERVILGGGVVEMVPELIQTMASQIRAGATLLAKNAVRISGAELGEWAGAVGAASLVTEETAPSDPS
jgi:glucokinase